MRKPILLPFLPAFAVLAACAQVPITGRRSLILVPDSEVSALSADSYRDLLNKSKLSHDADATAMLRRVGARIARAADRPDYHWEFNLIESKEMNAFCMPGGKVAFYTGILPVTENETGMAAVMGHEVGHALAKHGAERLSQQLVVTAGAITLEESLRARPDQTRALAATAFGVGASLGYILPFSRLQESEADHIGLILMARAGYDPREAVQFWHRMEEKASAGQPPPFLSTHPSHGTRIRDLKKWMPEALKEYEKARKSAE